MHENPIDGALGRLSQGHRLVEQQRARIARLRKCHANTWEAEQLLMQMEIAVLGFQAWARRLHDDDKPGA